MKTKLLLLFLFFATICNGQARIGFTISEISTEFTSNKQDIENNENLGTVLTIYFDRHYACYIFDNDTCIITLVITTDVGQFQRIVEFYNSHYVIISSTEWKYYTNGNVMIGTIETTTLDDSSTAQYFLWRDE